MLSIISYHSLGYNEVLCQESTTVRPNRITAWWNIRNFVWVYLWPWQCASAFKGITSAGERGQALSKPTLAALPSQKKTNNIVRWAGNHLCLLLGHACMYSMWLQVFGGGRKRKGKKRRQLYFSQCHSFVTACEKLSSHVQWENCFPR